MRINKMNTYCFALIFYQILSTHSLRKYIKISLENLYVDIMGLKGLTIPSTPTTPKCTLQQRFLVFPWSKGYFFSVIFRGKKKVYTCSAESH